MEFASKKSFQVRNREIQITKFCFSLPLVIASIVFYVCRVKITEKGGNLWIVLQMENVFVIS